MPHPSSQSKVGANRLIDRVLMLTEAIDAVGFAMDLQEALLEVKWPAEILRSPDASQISAASNKTLFNGLRVRLAIHTGIPTNVQVWPSKKKTVCRNAFKTCIPLV